MQALLLPTPCKTAMVHSTAQTRKSAAVLFPLRKSELETAATLITHSWPIPLWSSPLQRRPIVSSTLTGRRSILRRLTRKPLLLFQYHARRLLHESSTGMPRWYRASWPILRYVSCSNAASMPKWMLHPVRRDEVCSGMVCIEEEKSLSLTALPFPPFQLRSEEHWASRCGGTEGSR